MHICFSILSVNSRTLLICVSTPFSTSITNFYKKSSCIFSLYGSVSRISYEVARILFLTSLHSSEASFLAIRKLLKTYSLSALFSALYCSSDMSSTALGTKTFSNTTWKLPLTSGEVVRLRLGEIAISARAKSSICSMYSLKRSGVAFSRPA